MQDLENTLSRVERLLQAIKDNDKLSFGQAYELRKLAVELNQIAIVK